MIWNKIILKEQTIKRRKRISLYSQPSVKIHTKTMKSMFWVILYFALFIWIVLLQLQLSKRYDQTSLKVSLESESISLTPNAKI